MLAGTDGGDGFFEIRAMPGMADGLRVVGARASAFGGRGDDRGVRGQGLFEFEDGQLIIAQDGGSGRTMDADLGGKPVADQQAVELASVARQPLANSIQPVAMSSTSIPA